MIVLFSKLKIYYYFWIVSIVILLVGIIQKDEVYDINVHDTYYVIENIHLTLILCNGYFFLGAGYWLVEKILRKKLIWFMTLIHSIILIGGFIFYWLIILYYELKPKSEFPLFDDDYTILNSTLLILFLLIVFIAQPIYVINLLIGILRKNQAFS